jgi:hypothetical protein
MNYSEAAHAIQTGVAMDIELDAMRSEDRSATSTKHLRVGVNMALVEQAAIAKLLIDKGLITQREFDDAITHAVNEEAKRYEQHISERLGRRVTLR